MHEVAVETLFARFADTGDPDALAAVFDQLAGKLLLVAAHLAGGSVAEDLVQATFVDAIRQRQRWDRARPLAPWLIGLLGNHVARARRERLRVPDPQRVATRESEPAGALAEANECFEAVAAAVQALPRHYRQVLSLRLVHGLELQQIAHSLDVPLGTVKVRLHRGLALLRRALPVGLTASIAMLATPSLGLAAARQAVLAEAAAACGTAGAVTTGVILGGWMMKKLVLGAAAIALAVGGWFTFGSGDAVTPVSALPEAPAAVVAPVAAAEPKVEAPPSPPAATAAQVAQTPERSEAATTGSLDLRVVWASDKAPAAGLELDAYQRREPAGRSPVVKRSEHASARSDAGGRARFDGLVPGTYHVLATGAKQSSVSSRAYVRAGETTEFELVVGGDMCLHVTVVGTDGSPRRDATLWCYGSMADGEPHRQLGTTDSSGRWRYRGLPLRVLWARAPGSEPSQRHELPNYRDEELPAEPVEVRLTLGPAGCTLHGTVFAPGGSTAAGASVAIACDDMLAKARPEIVLRADAQGAFRCDEVPAGVRNVVASLRDLAPAYVRVTTSSAEPATVVLQLRTGVTLSGRVADAAGQPVANTQVCVRRAGALGIGSLTLLETRTDAEGRYELRGIAPGGFMALVYVEPQLQQKLTGADGEHVVWNPTRDPERAISGVVVDAEDKPLANWQVTAMGPASRVPLSPPRPCYTDAEGRFRISGLEDAPHCVSVFAAMDGARPYGTASLSGSRLSAAGLVPCTVLDGVRPSNESLTIRVPATAMATAWIEGSLTLPEGMRAKAELSLYPKAIQGRGGFYVPQERLALGETTYRIGPLPPGDYHLLCDIEGRGRLEQRGLRLAPNETLRLPPFAFDAQRPLVVVLRHADGRVAAGATVKLKTWPVAFRETAPGTYESIPVGEGDDEITVHGPDLAPQGFAVRRGGTAPVELTVRSATPVVVRLSPMTPRERWVGALGVAVIDAQGTKLVDDMMQLDAGAEFRWRIGLLPGTYTLNFNEMLHGRASTTATVGTEPLQIDLQITK